MGYISKKKKIFNELSTITSIKDNINLPNPKNSLKSINNSKEIIPFFLDLLVVLKGSHALESLVGELMTGFLRNVEPKLKTELKKQIIEFNSDKQLSSDFINNGVNIDASKIDLFEKYKTDPSSQTGSLLYNTSTDNFDKKSYDAILASGSEITYNNIKILYDNNTNSFNYKPNNSGQTIGEFSNEYIDNLIIIDEKEFTSNVVNSVFGTINNDQNKTQKQLILEEKINRTITKIINEEEDISINDSELRDIELSAQKRKDGIQTVDVGCGVLNNTVTLSSLENLINITSGSTDPLTVGNAYTGLIIGGFNPSNESKVNEDGETIKDDFLKKLINTIVNTLVFAIVAQPQIRGLLGITTSFKNNGVADIGDPTVDFKNKRKLINCLTKEAKSTINEFIFNIIKIEIINLIVPVSKKIVKEKLNQYLGILRSLIPSKN